ncbi:hypothetical protein BATDEDRAFT_28304 [Batrachochytrium dendrobatidis JAM81]|uniref:DNA-directed DNA polymerase n=1 Tax=Batrachochytrium dendrobatidis (strain JAM81 / FGSC 10211) TaxID=684364 RepID=F4PDM1_BATDJ|nr:uncharacterized protein BATDEDRAFT_28304 [Batrachochytrium dendrobatidis JAM81]EGF76807.1 hypothetical protein BATDEDRAFT_28304 [Batrachochytrium dendrobatidis JAM81]|eukprot:XP_006682618.1 hypothetical protein BATDEDRAFT_28304 [Batrachochytrium dendrobatidis JAM81]
MVFTHTNLYDLLSDYNNLDVKPGVEATKKLGNFFQSLNLDIHKNGIFVPRLTLKYLWHTKSKDCKFQLFKGNDELYHKYKDNLVGGPKCDIAVPEHLKEYFAGMPLIFKDVEITCNDLSFDTQAHAKPDYKSNRLVESMFGETMMFATKLLKWYLEHGLVVSNITFAVRYERKAHFKSFDQQVSNERRAGDTSPDYKLRGEMMKLMEKSSYGKCITDFLKHETVKIVGPNNYNKNVRRVKDYIGHQDLVDGFEFRFKKTAFKQSLPYRLASKSDFQYCMMDTDSAYFAISGSSLQDVVKPHLLDEFKQKRQVWLERDDTLENKLYDSRTPGLFKLEYEGDCIISLASKMYYYDEKKFSSKGINKRQNEITKYKYLSALNGNANQGFRNSGFRANNNQMNTYSPTKTGMKLFNDKRLRVMDKLYKLYYSPKTGFISARKLYLKLDKQLPISQTIKFLDQQEVHQLHQESQRKPALSPITSWRSCSDTQSGNGYSFSISDDNGNVLGKSYKYYELKRVEVTETFLIEPRHREPTMTNKERRNKRELQELARVQGPTNKKTKKFGATYFLK